MSQTATCGNGKKGPVFGVDPFIDPSLSNLNSNPTLLDFWTYFMYSY
jgi:hypothetical protein